ncbi:MAG: DnaJ domain-containing protein [Kiloniellales bacterium]|nr:DnaJ domain-containing protein [Kiloniellales bacterium]
MFDPEEKISKLKVEVAVDLEDGARLLGFFFVKHLQRLSDLLNDHRQFLPLRLTDGSMVHLQKTKIVRVAQLTPEPDAEEAFDPYEVLGIAPGVSDEQLKAAYHGLCSDYHPDKLQGLGLPAEFSEIANARIIRIIDAYRRITARRGGASGKAKEQPFSPVS